MSVGEYLCVCVCVCVCVASVLCWLAANIQMSHKPRGNCELQGLGHACPLGGFKLPVS
jgi:hypothetical protein